MKGVNINEFSKRVIIAMTYVFIGGAIFGAVIITAQTVGSYVTQGAIVPDMASYLTYLATPISCGVVGYMCKAAFENREKIRANTEQHYDSSQRGE